MTRLLIKQDLLVPALPADFMNGRKPPSILKRLLVDRYLSGSQLYDLSEHMNSENSRNIPAFLWGVISKLRNVSHVSLFLTSLQRIDILEHYVTVDRTETVGKDSFSASFEQYNDAQIIEGNTLSQAIRVNHGGQGFFFDSKTGKVRNFSMRTHDFSIGISGFEVEDPLDFRHTAVIPLRSSDSDRVIGCLVFSGDDLRLENKFFVMSAMTFLAASTRLLYSLVNGQLDSLTKLMKRSVFESSLLSKTESYLRQPLDPSRKFSVIICDIDHFKLFNDKHGHQEGDRVLRDVATVTRSTTRAREGEYDLVARFGGEEFIILLDVDIGGALSAASRLRKNVFAETGTTCSYGVVDSDTVAYLLSRRMVNLEDLQRKFPDFDNGTEVQQFAQVAVYLADKALYRAKGKKDENGRNRVAYARQVQPGENIFTIHASSIPQEPTKE